MLPNELTDAEFRNVVNVTAETYHHVKDRLAKLVPGRRAQIRGIIVTMRGTGRYIHHDGQPHGPFSLSDASLSVTRRITCGEW